MTLYKEYNHTNHELGVTVSRSIYLARMPDISQLVCNEGKIATMSFQDSLDCKMIPGFTELLKEIHIFLRSKDLVSR